MQDSADTFGMETVEDGGKKHPGHHYGHLL